MFIKKYWGLIIILLLCVCGCRTAAKENVVLTFIQHSYIKHNIESGGYYFKNDQIAVTELIYEKGYYLNQNEINNLYNKVEYQVPELNGDGYWSFTFFTKYFDETTGYSNDFLKEQVLSENMTIHFGIYG